MKIATVSTSAILVPALWAVLLIGGMCPLGLALQEEGPRPGQPVSDEGADPEKLERQLDEIQRLLERAERQDDQDQVRRLRAEGERLLDQLEEFERSRPEGLGDREESEVELRELEIERLHLEIQRLHVELQAVRQESARRMTEIASMSVTSAAYAVQWAAEHLEEEEARDFLLDLLEEVENPVVKRIIRHHAVRLSFAMDRSDDAVAQLRALILED